MVNILIMTIPNHYLFQKTTHLFQTLQQVYTEQTGKKLLSSLLVAELMHVTFETGVAFGALFPGREDTMHQKDEFSYFDDLLKATAIYAEALQIGK